MLADFESELELLAFPNGRYDEQVDALLLFLDWYQEGRYYLTPKSFSMPIIFPAHGTFPGICRTGVRPVRLTPA